jgi:hypothetical protein
MYRKQSQWTTVLKWSITAAALHILQIFVIWLAFNFFGRAFSWPHIDFWQAGALYVLCRCLVQVTTVKESK